jgi:glycosyltransferase involved in cell wall biosynthesis
MSKISVLMTVYNEAEFVDYAIRACLPHVNHLVIVEGAYQETIACGASPRSTDGTIDICKARLEEFAEKNLNNPNHVFSYIEANEHTDKDQRNLGLAKIKELDPDGWVLIIDGDEVYDKATLNMVKVACHNMERQGKLAAYFKSLTFVNDLRHYTEQEFPRLFRITPDCKFVNDNFMEWPDKGINWFSPYVIKIPYIRYHHYAFCKGLERFELKKKWWETRFDMDFDYGWHMNMAGKIEDPNHQIFEYTGKHPAIMSDHPAWKRIYDV